MSLSETLHPSLSINDVIRIVPAAVGPLHAHGIDACCRGNESLATAAAGAGVEPIVLIAEIAGANRAATGVCCGCGCDSAARPKT